MNAPRFGTDDNYLYSSVQVNIARPVPFEECMIRHPHCLRPAHVRKAGKTLKDLGSFGEPHVDGGDMPEGFTAAKVCSHLPPEIDPG